MGKKFDYTEPQIIDYNIDHLDALEGNVSDYTYQEKALPAVQPQRNLVLPSPAQPADRSAGVASALGYLMVPTRSSGTEDAAAIQHMQAMSEKSTPRERAVGRLLSWVGWAVVAGVVAYGLYMAGLRGDLTWVIYVLVVGYGVIKTTQDDNAHSPAGVERHKTAAYSKIAIARIKAEDRANARNHETFNRVIDQVYGGPDRVQNRIPRQRQGK